MEHCDESLASFATQMDRLQTYRDLVWWPPPFMYLLHALQRFWRPRLVVVKLVAFDPDPHDLPGINIHAVRDCGVE